MSQDFKPGDRVRLSQNEGIVVALSTTDYNGVLVAWKGRDDRPSVENRVFLTLVARAVYMTPEQILYIERTLGAETAYGPGDMAKSILAALAETRGEA
jgi:hypothetical protein